MGRFTAYRSIVPKKDGYELIKYRPTMRPPRNVPYLVDNLWEWVRPESYPCRRTSVFASLTKELAFKSGPKGGMAFEIEFNGQPVIAQLKGFTDSKYHPECKSLKKLLINLLRKESNEWWPDWDLKKKSQVCQLWFPCLRRQEVEELFENVPLLQVIKKEVQTNVTYWNNVELVDIEDPRLPDHEGEIFFEARDGYRLLKTDESLMKELENKLGGLLKS